jgi:hypothetical protein
MMSNTRRLPLALASAALGSMALVVAALAAPAAAAPPTGGPFAHSHHVHTGNGGCVDIAAVLFNPEHRGLHQGSNASTTDRGPYHGTCDSRVFPGGPLLVDIGRTPHH